MNREPLCGFLMSDMGYLMLGRLLGLSSVSLNYYMPDIYWMYKLVKQITDWILIEGMTDPILSDCMQGSGGLLTEYSFCVCRSGRLPPDIHLAYARVRQMTNPILSDCMQGSGG
jgi:hypothetical protein